MTTVWMPPGELDADNSTWPATPAGGRRRLDELHAQQLVERTPPRSMPRMSSDVQAGVRMVGDSKRGGEGPPPHAHRSEPYTGVRNRSRARLMMHAWLWESLPPGGAAAAVTGAFHPKTSKSACAAILQHN